jgi:hypothetical protein
VEREKTIYDLWRLGYTINEIQAQTGMPRSSVGYYVAKFNKKQKGNKSRFKPPIHQPKRFGKAIYEDVLYIYIQTYTAQWIKLMNEGKYQTARDLVESIFLFLRLEIEIQYMMESKR